ncbi:RagB/SusD family nutrient uptake outer membrane protein [Elizabethkingia sp. JS20170427COW]|uniref:RagB/SusD family nutrient uptake outer membrane protein n=1 Tax=Elizabethkingia sp. JS20170427COW TaxID=2583851 RepID=UPI0011106BFA|nr:RagB/SusD family nutrient uptake outer membrane protein [Elizabethkingia sp. JS20170427COW]QCX52932.1 hypothetical protein FGE20_03845 [Elizabethkingia sp. JS20170427COW]
MKKLIIPIFSAAALAFSLNSCNLDRFPEDQITSETFWTSERDALLGLNGIYSIIGDEAYTSWYNDAFADNAYTQYSWESSATIASAGDITANNDFGYSWTTIRRANTFMSKIGDVSMDTQKKERFIAEAKFLRALSYFNLAQTFGAIPLFEEPMPDKDKLAPVPEKDVI